MVVVSIHNDFRAQENKVCHYFIVSTSICYEVMGPDVATGLEKVSFHSNPKERQFQRMLKLPHNCNHLTC